MLHNTDTDFTSFTIDHALISTSATGADGFLASLNGTTDGQVSLTNSELTLIDQDGAQITNNGSGTIRAIVQGNNFHDADATGGDGNNTLYLTNSASGRLNFTVGGPSAADGNTFHNLARLTTLAGVLQVDATSGTAAGGQINGTIQFNNIWNDAGFVNGRRAIDVQVEAQGGHNLGTLAVAILNNTVNNVAKQGIHISTVSVAGSSSTDGNWTIQNNSLGAAGTNNGLTVGTEGAVDSGSAIEFETNIDVFTSGADLVNKLLVQGNTAINSNNSGSVGVTLDIANIGGTAASGTTSVLHATILNNIITNNTAGGRVVDILNSSAGDGETLNLNISGNNTTLGGDPAGEIRLRELNGTFNVQGGVASVSANNSGDTVSTTGSFGTIGSVLLPTAPSFLQAAPGGVEAAQWQIAGVCDFNGDGWADALLLRDDGLLGVGTINGDPPPPWPATRPTSAPSPARTSTARRARRSPTATRPTTSSRSRQAISTATASPTFRGRATTARLPYGSWTAPPAPLSAPSARSTRGRPGTSRPRATSTATARPTSSGNTTTASLRCG